MQKERNCYAVTNYEFALAREKRERCAANPPVTAHTENKHSTFTPLSTLHSLLTDFPLDIFSRLGTVYSFMSTNSIDIFY